MAAKESFFENEYCEYWIEDGILREIFKTNFDVLDVEIAKIITRDRLIVSNGRYLPLYVELGEAIKMKRDANRYLSSGEAMTYLTATGILVTNELERFGASLYTTFFRPKIPTKFFTDKQAAIFWLSKHKIESLN